jgi:hypothetical protein
MLWARLETLWGRLRDWWRGLEWIHSVPDLSDEMLDPDRPREPPAVNPTTQLPMYDEDMDGSMTLYGFEEEDN